MKEINEHNLKVLLGMVMSVLNKEQIDKLDKMISELKPIEQEKTKEFKSYVG